MREFVLDATVVAAFQRTQSLAALRSLALPLVIVDAVQFELTGAADQAPTEHQKAIRDAVAESWLRVEPLPAQDAAVPILMGDRKVGMPVDIGEAASIALCLRRPEAVFVTSDRGGFFAAAKHLHGDHARVLSLYGFLRELVDRHSFPLATVRSLIHYADQGASLRPAWWDDWLRTSSP